MLTSYCASTFFHFFLNNKPTLGPNIHLNFTIAGEEYPSDGTAFIFGKDIRSDPKVARRHVRIVFLV